MKERPILFNGPMVRALLDGQKTQTRRAVKPVGNDGGFVLIENAGRLWPYRSDDGESGFHTVKRGGNEYLDETPHECPYGQPGDRLWVREATHMRHLPNFLTGDPTNAECGVYSADSCPVRNPDGFDLVWWYSRKSCPSIHMPRWASRITLEIVSVRVERLQDISEQDAKAEGCNGGQGSIPDYSYSATPGEHFMHVWASAYGNGSWIANPWVWVVEFRRLP